MLLAVAIALALGGEAYAVYRVHGWVCHVRGVRHPRAVRRDKGTPQGGVVSPLLANLFLHYAISRCGDEMMRVMLYEAAQSMLRSKKWSWLKAWAMQIARRRGMKRAIVALARRLAVIMHRIWVDGTEFRWTREQATAAA